MINIPETDTPETDAMSMTDDPLDLIAMIEHARKLERERDEARRYANNIDLCQGGVAPCDLAAKLMEKLDEARIQEDIHYQNYLQMQRERDEAREQLAIAKAERNAAHLKCHRIAEEIMAWLADPQPNNTTPPATSK